MVSRYSTFALFALIFALSVNAFVPEDQLPSNKNVKEINEHSSDLDEWQEFKAFQEYKNKKWRTKSRHDRGKDKKSCMNLRFNDGIDDDRFDNIRHNERSKDYRSEQKDYSKKKDKRDYELIPGREDPALPSPDKAAAMARYIVNKSVWTAVATISSHKETDKYPFVNLKSVSDGPVGNGSGIPYFYITPLDFTGQDLIKDSRATIMMTLAQEHHCVNKNWDLMDPRCPRVLLTGKIKAIRENSPDEMAIAKAAIFGRHPKLENLPAHHRFFFAKLKISTIAVLDDFGGPKYVTLRDYFHPLSANFSSETNARYLQDYEQNLRDPPFLPPAANV